VVFSTAIVHLHGHRGFIGLDASGIRVNTVSPGNVNTPMHANDDKDALAKFHPLARMGEISDIVDAVLYLQNATFVTGENIRVDGGVHAGR
jgi:NAD(P)-dependent dehydrogenase (short-subunit alcohol dehydrogenase family)